MHPALSVIFFTTLSGAGYGLLFWSALCFAGLSLNNFLLVIDRLVLPAADLSTWRLTAALLAPLLLLYGLIWEEE